MKIHHLRLLLASVLILLLSGCTSMQEEDSQLPWSQPASWENQVPGMPGSAY